MTNRDASSAAVPDPAVPDPAVPPVPPADGPGDRAADEHAGRPPGGNLRARALHGSAWTIGGHAAGQGIRFLNNLALTYLVAPELLGLMGTVHVFISGLHLLSDFGIGQGIIHNQRGDDPEFYDTGWTVHAVRGATIWLLTFALGPLLAALYAGQPGAETLVWLMPLVGTSSLIAGLHSTALYTLNRHLRLRPIVILDVGAQLLGCAVGLTWALLDPTIWALVATVFVQYTAHTIGSHFLGVRNRPRWDREAARSLVRFGRWIWVSTMLTFAALQIDRLVMPKLIGFDGQAVYQVGLFIAMALPEAAHVVGSRVVFPVLSDLVRRQDTELSSKLLRARQLMVLPAVTGLVLLSLGGEALVHSLYHDDFAEAGWMLRVLAAAAIPQVLVASSWYAFFAMGRTFAPACLQAAKLVLKVTAMVIGYQVGGAPGIIFGLLVAETAHYPLVVLALRRYHVFQPQLDIPVLLGSYAIVTAGWLAW